MALSKWALAAVIAAATHAASAQVHQLEAFSLSPGAWHRLDYAVHRVQWDSSQQPLRYTVVPVTAAIGNFAGQPTRYDVEMHKQSVGTPNHIGPHYSQVIDLEHGIAYLKLGAECPTPSLSGLSVPELTARERRHIQQFLTTVAYTLDLDGVNVILDGDNPVVEDDVPEMIQRTFAAIDDGPANGDGPANPRGLVDVSHADALEIVELGREIWRRQDDDGFTRDFGADAFDRVARRAHEAWAPEGFDDRLALQPARPIYAESDVGMLLFWFQTVIIAETIETGAPGTELIVYRDMNAGGSDKRVRAFLLEGAQIDVGVQSGGGTQLVEIRRPADPTRDCFQRVYLQVATGGTKLLIKDGARSGEDQTIIDRGWAIADALKLSPHPLPGATYYCH